MTSVLVGSTGFIGSELSRGRPFDMGVHRPDVANLRGIEADFLVCAGLPAAKWAANQNPIDDFDNVATLAGVLDTMVVDRFVLISTVDVYQPPSQVDETNRPQLDGPEPYGRHRAWFERFVMERFESVLIVRLPGLFGPGLRKNLVFDLLEGRTEQYQKVDARSRFQFWNVTETWNLIESASDLNIEILNVATEPVSAGQIAELFCVALEETGPVVDYDMRTVHAKKLIGRNGPYLRSTQNQLAGIAQLCDGWRRL